MLYVYMDNFRGFYKNLIPIQQINFLVGENSTGKTSFLKLLKVLSNPTYWGSPQIINHEDFELGDHDDIFSASSTNKHSFRIGVLLSFNDNDQLKCEFAVHEFTKGKDGNSQLKGHLEYVDKHLTKILFAKGGIKYRIDTNNNSFKSEQDIEYFFKKNIEDELDDNSELNQLEEKLPNSLPLPLIMHFIKSEAKKVEYNQFDTASWYVAQQLINMKWIAPIRTEPQRFYSNRIKRFSPQGEHIPFLLNKKSKSKNFLKQLNDFGNSSGLFENVLAHSFKESTTSPIEILVKFNEVKLNIQNVGYGVSQVLPLIVEFLSSGKNQTFAVQQPEIHLHPKAQAALGDLVANLVVDKEHRFILETHSDYIIDRFRLNLSKRSEKLNSQVLFFNRIAEGNEIYIIKIHPDGKYSENQPKEFRDFFIKEEIKLLEV